MKKLIIAITVLAATGCSTQKELLNYSAYESHGGFNYAEDVFDRFDSADEEFFKNLPIDFKTRETSNVNPEGKPGDSLLTTKTGDLLTEPGF